MRLLIVLVLCTFTVLALKKDETIDLHKVCRALRLLKTSPKICRHRTKKYHTHRIPPKMVVTYYKTVLSTAKTLLHGMKDHIEEVKKRLKLGEKRNSVQSTILSQTNAAARFPQNSTFYTK